MTARMNRVGPLRPVVDGAASSLFSARKYSSIPQRASYQRHDGAHSSRRARDTNSAPLVPSWRRRSPDGRPSSPLFGAVPTCPLGHRRPLPPGPLSALVARSAPPGRSAGARGRGCDPSVPARRPRAGHLHPPSPARSPAARLGNDRPHLQQGVDVALPVPGTTPCGRRPRCPVWSNPEPTAAFGARTRGRRSRPTTTIAVADVAHPQRPPTLVRPPRSNRPRARRTPRGPNRQRAVLQPGRSASRSTSRTAEAAGRVPSAPSGRLQDSRCTFLLCSETRFACCSARPTAGSGVGQVVPLPSLQPVRRDPCARSAK